MRWQNQSDGPLLSFLKTGDDGTHELHHIDAEEGADYVTNMGGTNKGVNMFSARLCNA